MLNNNILIEDDLFYKITSQKPYLCNDIEIVENGNGYYHAQSIIGANQNSNFEALLNRIMQGFISDSDVKWLIENGFPCVMQLIRFHYENNPEMIAWLDENGHEKIIN